MSSFVSELICGHVLGNTGVTVTIVETSNVGVKVGMVGKGVMDAVGVWVGDDVFDGNGDGVAVAFSITGTGADCPQAERRNIMMRKAVASFFMMILPGLSVVT